MTTVDESVQPAPSPLGDPDRAGEVRTAAGPVAWAAVGRASAPAVLLLPAADDLLGWPPGFVTALVASGVQVVAVTAPPQAPDDVMATADAAVAALLAAGSERAHVVGASQGGLVAQAMAAAHPARVASLTLLMTRRPTGAALEVAPELLSVLAPMRGGGLLLDRITEATEAIGAHTGRVGAGAASRVAVVEAGGADPVTALLSFAVGEDRTVPPLAPVPALVVAGASDPVVPLAAARGLAEALGTDLVVLRSGHDLPWGHESSIARRLAALVAEDGRTLGTTAGRSRRRPSRFVMALGVFTALVMVAVIAASTIDVPYYSISPGSARRTNDLVEVPADRRFPPKGELLFVTVGVGRLKALGWVVARQDSDVEIVPERDILGTTPKGEYREQVTQEMVDAKETAAVVALKRLCERVEEMGTGARVDEVVERSPAATAGLIRGDVVTAVDGRTVTTAAQALDILRSKPPGTPLMLTAVGPTEAAQPRTAVATLTGRQDDPARPFLGVSLRTRQQDFALPFEVTIDSGRVGGPSAGLEFALSIVDQLTPGEMTGGRKVAVTGTIEADGSVGPVGGIPQKTVTVRRAGAKLFLVPTPQVDEARAKAGAGVEVVGVDTLDGAIKALSARGGDISGIPGSCPSP